MPRTRVLALFLATLSMPHGALAQEVSTVVTGFTTNGDVAISQTGDLYFSTEGAVVYRRTPAGTTALYASGFASSRGVLVDATGDTLFVADFAGIIRKVAPGGVVSTFATSLPGATGLAWGPDGNIYCTTSTTVYRVRYPSGAREVVAAGAVFNRPHGIGVGPTGTVYVASAHDGNIYAVTENEGGAPTIELLAHVDGLQQAWACGFMAYSAGSLYITNGDNKVHRITVAGEESTHAGSGTGGWVDGPAETAQFLAPNGIAATPDGARVYVAEYGVQRIRLIESAAVGVGDASPDRGSLRLVPARPNPFAARTSIGYELATPGHVTLRILDVHGRLVRTLVDRLAPAGRAEVRWNGTDARGHRVTAGVYFYHLTSGEVSVQRTMTLVR